MNIRNLTRSPLDRAIEIDADTLILGPSFFQFQTEIDSLILRNLDYARDEYGEESADYLSTLNL